MNQITQLSDIHSDLARIAPELILAVAALILLPAGAFMRKSFVPITFASIGALILAALWLAFAPDGNAFNGAFTLDPFARVIKIAMLAAASIALAMAVPYLKTEGLDAFEYPVLIVLASFGMGLMISAGNLLTLYLGAEMQSLTLYALAALRRDSLRSSEAGLKYFVLGALSSGMTLYGISLVYGFAGHVGFEAIAEAARQAQRSVTMFTTHYVSGEFDSFEIQEFGGRPIGLLFGLVFILAGIGFKISAVPFHMWTPDVYEGSPTCVTAFFAAAPKLAGMALLVRLLMEGFQPLESDWRQIVSFLAIASMGLGAFAAIGQSNLKRLMAYSSIGHMGYALLGLAAASRTGIEALIIYMLVYVAMTLGTFACLLAMRRKEGMTEGIGDLAGLGSRNPGFALALTLLMFSLAGLPPLGGFFAKYFVFAAAIEADLIALAIFGILASVVAAFYYLRIVKIMWFDEAGEEFFAIPGELKAVLGVSAVFVTFFIWFAAPFARLASNAAGSFF